MMEEDKRWIRCRLIGCMVADGMVVKRWNVYGGEE